ncbi:Carbonic anhydrase [Clostridium bornimense]|uniref:carbonic anhydrase n=1 Tax=Clostridium bornimense TaxID=1216932 RepID=W6SEE8_9CLOT|nr:carbonic anhydrase [Clostridium bornimense]CDM68025.1 Carbonic anhydrase [Clostridium bornimense]
MSKLEEILEFNKNFVENKEYEKYETSKNPKKKMVILSCMDTRLTDLLPRALNIKNGDAKLIKNAGAAIMHPFGSIMRSIIVAVYEFNADEVFVVGHSGCGMCNLNTEGLLQKVKDRGISEETLNTLANGGIDVKGWLHGFDSVEKSIEDSVNMIKNHPLMPEGVAIHGLIIDPATGKLDVHINGYEK